MKRNARLALAVIFLGLLATPALLRRLDSGAAPAAADAPDPLGRYGFRLTEVSKQSGIDFVHEAPILDSKLAHHGQAVVGG